jgi:hypothetical protein
MADALLRADTRKQRAAAMPKPTPKKAPLVPTGPRRLHLSDLKRAIATKHRCSPLAVTTTEPAVSGAIRESEMK